MNKKRISLLIGAGLALASAAAGALAETYQWGSVPIGGGGYVTGVVPSKSERGVVYVRTDVGGAYRWDARHSRWVALLDWVSEAETGLLGVESLAVDPRNAAHVVMLAGTSYFNNGKTAILRSTDYGKTFEVVDVSAQFKAHGNGMGRGAGEKLQIDPGSSEVLYAGTRRNGLFKSTDGGATWGRLAGLPVTTTPNDNGVSFVLLDPGTVDGGQAQFVFAGISRTAAVGPNLYFSSDAGASFEPIAGGPAGLLPQRAALAANGKLYITYANGAGPHPQGGEPLDAGQIWEYDTLAGNWLNVTPKGINTPFSGISVDPANPKRLVASTINTWRLQYGSAYGDRIYTSVDGGRNWTDVVQRGFALDNGGVSWVQNHAIHWAGAVEFDPFDPKAVWVTSGNGLFKTPDIDAATTTWRFDVAGLEETVPLDLASIAGGPLVSAIGDYDGFVHDDTSTYGRIHTPQMGTTTGLAVAASRPDVMARAGSAFYLSSNGGASWSKTPTSRGAKGQLALSSDGRVLLHAPENAAVTYRSLDAGASWTAVAGMYIANASPRVDPVDPLRCYAYDSASGAFLVSSDGGASFAAAAPLARGGSNLIRAVPGRAGDLWVCLNGGGLVHSLDGGASFSKVASVNACGAVGFGKAAPGASYPAMYMWGTVGSVRGVLRSLDAGASWVRINDDAHEFGGPGNGQFVSGDWNTYGVVYMSTVGRGLVSGASQEAGDVTVVPVTPAPPPPAPVNKCDYVVTAAWQGGYNAAIRITNNGKNVINGWTVGWTYTDASRVEGYWNAAVSGTPPTYTATDNQSWNRDIWPGATVEFGITVSGAAIPTVSGPVCN
jgi:hypothetical protein